MGQQGNNSRCFLDGPEEAPVVPLHRHEGSYVDL